MRAFSLAWPAEKILQTPSAKSSDLPSLATRFPLPWSAYVRLLSVKNPEARTFYEREALRSGWSVRQLDRQIGSQFYERNELLAKVQRRMTLSEIRKGRKISQAKMAEALGIGQMQISRLEKRKDPRLSTMQRTVAATHSCQLCICAEMRELNPESRNKNICPAALELFDNGP